MLRRIFDGVGECFRGGGGSSGSRSGLATVRCTLQDTHTIHGIECPPPLRTRLDLCQFRLIRAIGHGCASTVFDAIHIASSVRCVIKICMKTRLHKDEERRFRREMNIHSALVHRAVLKFYAAFEDSHAFYIVMEYAEHGDLLHYIKKRWKGIMPFADFTTTVLEPLLLAVAYLHEQGILHRDIKPENILVDKHHHIKLCDFGFSINSYDERPQSYVGTVEYMPPEMVLQKKDLYSEKMDIWAIGILTYECLVGVSPFYMATERGIMNAIVEGSYMVPSHLNREVVAFLKATLHPRISGRSTAKELLRHPIFSSNTRRTSGVLAIHGGASGRLKRHSDPMDYKRRRD